jgi:hypothetical protein
MHTSRRISIFGSRSSGDNIGLFDGLAAFSFVFFLPRLAYMASPSFITMDNIYRSSAVVPSS